MKALITGAAGQLARQLIDTAPPGTDLKVVDRTECDITDLRAVERVIDAFRPDVVINTAAYTAVDAAEDARELAFLVNARGAENVARAAELAGARMVHISTDYVFDGDRSTPYPPDARTNPLNAYGASKLEGEGLVLTAAPSALVIRTGWLYSRTGKNFLNSILAALSASRPLRVVRDQVGCPSSANELAGIIWKASYDGLSGVYHWSNAGSASWYDFAVEIMTVAVHVGMIPEALPITGVGSDEYGSRAKRPRYSVLDCTLLARKLNVVPTAWRDVVRAELLRPLPTDP